MQLLRYKTEVFYLSHTQLCLTSECILSAFQSRLQSVVQIGGGNIPFGAGVSSRQGIFQESGMKVWLIHKVQTELGCGKWLIQIGDERDMKVSGGPGRNETWNGVQGWERRRKKHRLHHPDMQSVMYMFLNAFLCSVDTEHMTLLTMSSQWQQHYLVQWLGKCIL